MKILLITDSFDYCCGRSKHIFLLAKYFSGRGHTVSVAIGGGDGEPMLLAEHIQCIVMRSLLHQNRSLKNFAASVVKLGRLIGSGKYDVVHVHHPYASSIARFATKYFRIPHIYTIHGAVVNRGKLPFYVGDSFIAVNEATMEFVASEKPSIRTDIETICNGIDLSRSAEERGGPFRLQYGIDPDSILVSIIGRIVAQKGHEYVLSALKGISAQGANISCLIVGDGADRSSVEAMARSMPYKAVFTGSLPDVSDGIDASDIVVIPSLGKEGMPMTLLEAGAHAKPVVASALGGIKEVVIDSENGLLVPPGDVRKLTDALSALIEDRSLRAALGGRLRRTVEEMFSVERMGKKTLDHYGRLAGRFKGSRS